LIACPVRQRLFGEISRSESKHRLDDLIFGSVEAESVESEEDQGSEKGDAFVAVSEGVV
jgi:hypothetical protein